MHWLHLPHLPDTASAWLALALAFVLMTTSNFAALWLRDWSRCPRPGRPPTPCPNGCATLDLKVARRAARTESHRPLAPGDHPPGDGAGADRHPGK